MCTHFACRLFLMHHVLVAVIYPLWINLLSYIRISMLIICSRSQPIGCLSWCLWWICSKLLVPVMGNWTKWIIPTIDSFMGFIVCFIYYDTFLSYPMFSYHNIHYIHWYIYISISTYLHICISFGQQTQIINRYKISYKTVLLLKPPPIPHNINANTFLLLPPINHIFPPINIISLNTFVFI